MDPMKNEKFFLVGASISDNSEGLETIVKDVREGLRLKELKYHEPKRLRKTMERHVAENGMHVVGVIVNKEDSPPWWKYNTSRVMQHRMMITELSKDLVALDVDFDKIVLDDVSTLRRKKGSTDELYGKYIIGKLVGREKDKIC